MASAKSSGMLRSVINSFAEGYPMFVHECPYMGRQEVVNLQFVNSYLLMYPSGIYRLSIKVTEDKSKASLSIDMLWEITNF